MEINNKGLFMSIRKITAKIAGVGLLALGLAIIPSAAIFAANTDVTQQITGGTLTANILNASRAAVVTPTFAMSATNFSFDCQTATGTIGSSTQRLYVINPSGTTSIQSWNLTIAGNGTWTDGGNTYAYNDGTGAGCTNGQLTVDPSSGTATLTDDCVSTECTTAAVTQGSEAALSDATPVTLLSAPANTPVYRGYLTNVGLSQEIPGETPAGTYTLQMTITATAV